MPLINKNNTQSDIETGSYCEWGARKIDFSFFSGIFIFSNKAAVNQSKSRKKGFFVFSFACAKLTTHFLPIKGQFLMRADVSAVLKWCALTHKQRKCLSP